MTNIKLKVANMRRHVLMQIRKANINNKIKNK